MRHHAWNITNGGLAVFLFNSTIAIQSTFNATVAGTDLTTGQPAVISFTGAPALASGSASGITCNSGGFYDVNGITPAGNAGQIKLNTGAGLAYRSQTTDVFTLPAFANTTLVTWQGSNRLYLNGSTDTGSGNYDFTTLLGTNHYLGLVCAGNNTIAHQVSFDNNNGSNFGNLLFSAPVAATVTATFSGGIQTNTSTTHGSNQIPITVMGGTTQLVGGIGGNGGITLTSGSNGTLKLMTTGSGYGGQTLINGGTLAAGANNIFNAGMSGGGVNVSAGTLDISGTTGQVFAALTVGATGTLKLSPTNSFSVGNITLTAGSTIFISNSGNTLSSLPIILGTYTGLIGTNFTTISYNGTDNVGGGLPTGDSLQFIGGNLEIASAGPSVTNGQYTLTTVVTGTTLVHANGGTATLSTTIQNTGTSPQDTLTFSALSATAGSGTVGAASGTTSGTLLALGGTSTPAATQTYTAGATSGTVTIGNLATMTNTTAAGTPAATNTGTFVSVYSGLSTWTGASGGSWGTLSGGFGTNWGTNQGSPGVDAGFTTTDTATFGSMAGSVTVNLDGATPSLNTLTFNTTGSYTVAQGSGGGLTLAGGGPASPRPARSSSARP